MKLSEIKKIIEKYGLPGENPKPAPSSEKRFPDGAHYRMEVSGVERPEVLDALLDEREKRGVPIHRLISTVMGSTLLDKEELKSFAKMAHDARVEVILTPGPRSSWDTGRQVATPEGALCGLRLRGVDNVDRYIGDVMRAIDIGFRGFLVWDEGVLWLLSRMREDGIIPKETVFKVSIFAGHGNPFGAKVVEGLGANTINPLGDLSIEMFAAIRQAIDIPMDVHIFLFDSWGGFNRFWEAPELARVAAPCYFKLEPGASMGLYKPWVSPDSLAFLAREKVKYAQIIKEIIEENNPELKLSEQGPEDLAIPQP
ncbi:MAG: hypothetical protein DRQ06_04140 [Candidatus Hydrothermota bacterium]|nr:MAG: hypothetical protein DRQ06_04140 [Candidatus Hydrothermae bacterium]